MNKRRRSSWPLLDFSARSRVARCCSTFCNDGQAQMRERHRLVDAMADDEDDGHQATTRNSEGRKFLISSVP